MFRFERRARGRPSRKAHLAEPSIAASLPDITYRAVVEGQRWVGGQAKIERISVSCRVEGSMRQQRVPTVIAPEYFQTR